MQFLEFVQSSTSVPPYCTTLLRSPAEPHLIRKPYALTAPLVMCLQDIYVVRDSSKAAVFANSTTLTHTRPEGGTVATAKLF